jgi:glycosyltransferase involved in cell wall biosynthesis
MKIDVAVMTKNSEKYLDDVLSAIGKAVAINRLLIVDGNSEDKTLEIARRHNALIFQENKGLGYARQLAINQIETPIFMFLDSDLLFLPPYNWYNAVIEKLLDNSNLAAVVMLVPSGDFDSPRFQYVKFWQKRLAFTRKLHFTTGSTFIKTDALKGLQIPEILDAREDRYIELFIKNEKKMEVVYRRCEGIRYCPFQKDKASWAGANERLLTGIQRFPYLLFRNILAAPLKAIPPMFYYKNPQILFWSTREWFNYLNGFLKPMKYRKLNRPAILNWRE